MVLAAAFKKNRAFALSFILSAATSPALLQGRGQEAHRVILDPSKYDVWLACPLAAAPQVFGQWMGPLLSHAAAFPRGHRARITQRWPWHKENGEPGIRS